MTCLTVAGLIATVPPPDAVSSTLRDFESLLQLGYGLLAMSPDFGRTFRFFTDVGSRIGHLGSLNASQIARHCMDCSSMHCIGAQLTAADLSAVADSKDERICKQRSQEHEYEHEHEHGHEHKHEHEHEHEHET
ncbi:hypothetical protein CC78DRAFT_584151 [Lojkania enalia]|uniref:Uncharacterized protein n=1 Tax=Lojkania enalia TaxID=147567 RepID=A0A9P4K1V9_9PLEO|nr:hypothetical protein CC78DRAFT_584151 [Didymosphaeria enalia]